VTSPKPASDIARIPDDLPSHGNDREMVDDDRRQPVPPHHLDRENA
jgi:hypothetical protein